MAKRTVFGQWAQNSKLSRAINVHRPTAPVKVWRVVDRGDKYELETKLKPADFADTSEG